MTIRVGIIGTGNIGTSHATNLARVVSGSSVSVVFDADAARAREVAGDLGARVGPTVIDVIEADDVDAVLIASPDSMHAEQALIAIAAGKPMLCEKPLAVGDVNARNVVDAEVAFGRRLIQVGFMRRFDPGYNRLKAELTASGIGEPLIVHNVHRNTSAPYGLRTEQTLTNMVTHEFDINRWLIGEELTSVMVLPGKRGPLTPEGESDPILVVLQSQTGVLVEVEAFCNAQYGYEVQCRVTGSRGAGRDGRWRVGDTVRRFRPGDRAPRVVARQVRRGLPAAIAVVDRLPERWGASARRQRLGWLCRGRHLRPRNRSPPHRQSGRHRASGEATALLLRCWGAKAGPTYRAPQWSIPLGDVS